MSQEKYKEQEIKFFTELLKLLHITLLAAGGGTLSLIISDSTKIVFILFGLIISIICVIVLPLCYKKCRLLINDFKDGNI
jgi:hypothetical protein